MSNPHPSLLDRSVPANDVAKHLGSQLDLIQDLVDYGTNLVIRCMTLAPKRGRLEVVVLGVFLKHAIAMLDAIEIAIRAGATLGANLPARSFFEAQLAVEWILERDSETRALHYYVWQLRQTRYWAARVTPGTDEHTKFLKQVNALTDPGDRKAFTISEEVSRHGSTQLAELDALLNDARYRDVSAAFDHVKRGDVDRHWATPLEIKSIRQMAIAVGQGPAYDIFYSQMSDHVHATSWRAQVLVQKSGVTLQPIRHLEGVDTILRYACTLTFQLYRVVLRHYRPDELDSFNRIYAERWRGPFMSIPSFTYTSPGPGEGAAEDLVR